MNKNIMRWIHAFITLNCVNVAHSFAQSKPSQSSGGTSATPTPKKRKNKKIRPQQYNYDLVVIGAGASGMFAAGTASGFGRKTLLIEKHDYVLDGMDFHIGGDCTNSACVPSKAFRSMARVVAISKRFGSDLNKAKGAAVQKRAEALTKKSTSSKTKEEDDNTGTGSSDTGNVNLNFSPFAREHVKETVEKVRNRETPERLASAPNLDLIFTPQVSFDKPHLLSIVSPQIFNGTSATPIQIDSGDNQTSKIQIKAKKIIIATGASPIIPPQLRKSAKTAGLPILTYRSIFRPDGQGLQSNVLWNLKQAEDGKKKTVVIAGGGPTACEIAQSLKRVNEDINVTIVAPTILKEEDIAARDAVRKILKHEGVNMIPRRRVVDVSRIGNVRLIKLDDKTKIRADVLICALGREPGQNLQGLNLDKAGIEWDSKKGVIVDSKLQSVSSKHVFAAGDCASAVEQRDRRASHAGWTGYHAVQSAFLPKFLLPSDSVHPLVPRVTFLDPEIASIGMTRADCVRRYGDDGFKFIKINEEGTDRADIDSVERSVEGFVELRISIPRGRLLGATVCSPAASEIANEVGLAVLNKLTVRDVARCIHAYPSYGYLMHRASLALAMSDIWGMLAACGPLGKVVGGIGRTIRLPKFKSRRRREWEAIGTEQELDYNVPEWNISCVSYLEASKDASFCELVRRHADDEIHEAEVLKNFIMWLDCKPGLF